MSTATTRTPLSVLFGAIVICIGMLGVVAKLPPMNLYADNPTQLIFIAIICFGAMLVSAEQTILFCLIKIMFDTTRFSFRVVYVEPFLWAIGCISLVLNAFGWLGKIVRFILEYI